MLFGLRNAPPTFEGLMEAVLLCIIYETCLGYLEDVIAVDRTILGQLDNLRRVFP
jgi:hypothetical protein